MDIKISILKININTILNIKINQEKGSNTIQWHCSLLYYGFSQLSTSEFLKREKEIHETKNHLLCGWCNKCL